MCKNAKEEVLMKYITQEASIELLEEIHSGTAAIMSSHKPWSVKLSEQDSTGRPPWPMQRSWYATATGVSFS
jgi:hypothetical protein